MFAKGTSVLVRGLASSQSLNGKLGEVVKDTTVTSVDDRIPLTIAGEGKMVRRKNVVHISRDARLTELAHHTQLPEDTVILKALLDTCNGDMRDIIDSVVHLGEDEDALMMHFYAWKGPFKAPGTIWSIFKDAGGKSHIDPSRLSIFGNASDMLAANGKPYHEQTAPLHRVWEAMQAAS